MRTPLLAGLVGLLLPACVVGAGEITGIGDGDEIGDDGERTGTGTGDGDDDDTNLTPRVVLSVDKATVTTDLNVEEAITITATSKMGFAGDVMLTVTAADEASAPIEDWSIALANATLTVPADGEASTTVTLRALGDVEALAGSLNITGTSEVTVTDASVAVAFNPVLVVTFNDNGNGNCVYPTGRSVNNPWRLKVDRAIRVVNGSPNLGLQVHVSSIAGFPHQQNVSPPGGAYERTVTNAGDGADFYCHKGDGTMTEAGGSIRNYLRVVP